jgi:predicted metal-dependent hydrolase
MSIAPEVRGVRPVGRSTGRAAAAVESLETAALARLPGGDLPFILRRSPRARRLRLVVHPQRGLVVSVPPASRHGWARPERIIHDFIAEREPWIRRHLDRQEQARSRLAARPALEAGREILYLGLPHRVRVAAAPAGVRTTRVSRVGDDTGDVLLVERVARDRRSTAGVLEAWFRARARAALDAALERHASALGVTPVRITIRDTTSRWGSCSRTGRLSFSWRLVLAPPAALDAVAAHELCHLRVFGHGPEFRRLLSAQLPDYATWRTWLRRHASELRAALDDTSG